MPSTLDFLSAIFAGVADPIPVQDFDGVNSEVTEPEFFDAHEGTLYTRPLTASGIAFFWLAVQDVERDAYLQYIIPPTAALYKDRTLILVWALDQATAHDDVAEELRLAFEMEPFEDAYIPIPPTNGWDLVFVNADNFTTADVLAKHYTQIESKLVEEQPAASPAMYGDARMLTPYVETDYSNEIIITLGARKESKNWKPVQQPAGAFNAKLSRHIEGAKDGPAFVLADTVPGQRLKNAVKSLTGIGLDIDTGTPSRVIDAALAELKCQAVRYTTHSHNKTRTEFKKDTITKFAPDDEIDDELIRRFLREVEKWDESIIETAEYQGTDHTDKGIVICVSHIPMPKHRVIVLLEKPFVIADEGVTQAEAMKKWAKVPTALAEKLGVPLDKSCTDPSRLFYFPRHAKGKPFEISIFGGPYFDWRSLSLDNSIDTLVAEVTKGGSKSVTDEGRKLGRWSKTRSHGFQIADLVNEQAPDKIRGNATQGFDIECPFDEDHSNAGDTDDRACFVVNAGEGPSEVFTCSCRHETCRNKTNLDMLGKMINDGWFGKDVLEDEQYNALLEEDEPKPEPTPEETEKTELANKVFEEVFDKIGQLNQASTDDDLQAVLEVLVAAAMPPMMKDRAESAISAATKTKVGAVRRAILATEKAAIKKEVQKGKLRDPNGRMVFAYQGEFNFDEATDLCVKALQNQNERAQIPTFCCMQNEFVRLNIETMEGEKKVKFESITNQTLWSELSNLVTFMKRSDQGDGARKEVPKEVATHVFEQSYRQLRQAPEVIYTPLFLSDGNLVVTPKYHYDEKDPDYLNIFMVDNGLVVPEVPFDPSAEEAQVSLEWIRTELLSDFPFLDTDSEGVDRREASEANALAMILTPFMRRMIHGRTPVFFVDKPVPGTGGTLLGQLPMWLFDGAAGAATRYSQNEEEMQKGLIAAVQEPRSHLFFDDVKEFNNRELLRAITQANISGRLLGSSKNVTVPNRYSWIATGNNPIIFDEMRRRIIFIRMNAKLPDIQMRKFRHPDISGFGYEEFVRQNRGLAISHILTLIQYWISLGMPPFALRRRASFEDWSAKVGGVLQACGVEGFLDNLSTIDPDMDETSSKEFVRALYTRYGVNNLQKPNVLFKWALDMDFDIVEGNNDDQKKSRFMKRLAALNGRAFSVEGENCMVQRGYDKDENVGYRLVHIEHPTVESQEAA